MNVTNKYNHNPTVFHIIQFMDYNIKCTELPNKPKLRFSSIFIKTCYLKVIRNFFLNFESKSQKIEKASNKMEIYINLKLGFICYNF